MNEELERAYAAGDHRAARAQARRILADAAEPALQARAREIMALTAPDPFLGVVGLLGVGLLAWLVYNYVL